MRVVISPKVDDESAVAAAIELAIDRVIGPSYFAKPKQACVLFGISLSTFHRGVKAGLIKTTPRGDYEGVALSCSSFADEAGVRLNDRKIRRLKAKSRPTGRVERLQVCFQIATWCNGGLTV